MTEIPESLVPFLTDWFDVKTHGAPARSGVYRASTFGKDGEANMNLGYYYWDLQHWSGFASTAEQSYELKGKKNYVFGVNFWQGLIYPLSTSYFLLPRRT